MSYTSQTAAKCLMLLDFFTAQRPRLTASEIAEMAGMPLSTAFRLLHTLTVHRFLDYDPVTKKYRLGLKLLELGHLVNQQLDIVELAMPILTSLSHETKETAHLSIRDGDEGLFVAKVEGPQSLRTHTPLGTRVPLHAGASMKTILAFLPDEEIAAYLGKSPTLPAVTAQTETDAQRLYEDLMQIRERGFAISKSEQTEGAAGVGAPVRDHSGQVVGGITISGPEPRFTDETIAHFANLVLDAAAKLSAGLGYREMNRGQHT